MGKYLKYLYNDTAVRSRQGLLAMLDKKPGCSLVDLGCWDGENTLKFASITGAKKISGIELVPKKAQEARKKGIRVKIGDLNNKFQFPGNSFDAAIAYHVIEHLVNTKQFADETFRVLKKGGYALIGTPNLASWHNVFALLIGVQPFTGPHVTMNTEGHVKTVASMNRDRMKKVFNAGEDASSLRHLVVLTTKSLKKLLVGAGFEIEDVKAYGYYPFPGIIGRAGSAVDKLHSHYIIIKARKPLSNKKPGKAGAAGEK